MGNREQDGLLIAARMRITDLGNGFFLVPSQSINATYRVKPDPGEPSCTCEDFQTRRLPCKHIFAARFLNDPEQQQRLVEIAKEQARAVENREPITSKPRQTYRQAWHEYNLSQTNERRHFEELLFDLCQTVPEPPPRPGKGRKPVPVRDAVYAATLKVYGTFSARRSACDMDDAHQSGFLARAYHFNTVLRALENPTLTPIFHDLIRLSCLPLREVETEFACDSSGFSASRYSRWLDVRSKRVQEKADWVKAHLMTGVKTNIVSAVKILDQNADDSTQFLNCFIHSGTNQHQCEATASPSGNGNVRCANSKFFSFRWCRACDSFVRRAA